MTEPWEWCQLAVWAQEMGVDLDQDQLELFQEWARHLEMWGRRLNLTAIRGEREVARLHFLDSLTAFRISAARTASSVLDVGSGAGLPGVAMGIARPDLNVHLLEASARKARYLERLITTLGLERVRVLEGRAETIAHDPVIRESYSLVTARAVAPLPVLLEYCLPFCRPGGTFIAFKGPAAVEELKRAATALELLGGETQEIIEVTLPEANERRVLLSFSKTGSSNQRFPRPPGRPARRPLGS